MHAKDPFPREMSCQLTSSTPWPGQAITCERHTAHTALGEHTKRVTGATAWVCRAIRANYEVIFHCSLSSNYKPFDLFMICVNYNSWAKQYARTQNKTSHYVGIAFETVYANCDSDGGERQNGLALLRWSRERPAAECDCFPDSFRPTCRVTNDIQLCRIK